MALRNPANTSFAFADLTVIPRIPRWSPDEVDLRVRIAPDLELSQPFIASPMDTVTDGSVARKLAACGAFAILHYNYPGPRDQAQEVAMARGSDNLPVGALIPTDADVARQVEDLVEAGVSMVAIDSIHVKPRLHLPLLDQLKRRFPKLAVMSGNVAHPEDCARLIDHGVDCIRLGYGSGSINGGRGLLGMGRSLASAIAHCAPICREQGVPLVADGGLGNSAQISIALALGASAVMLGRLFAACEGTPGTFYRDGEGNLLKRYRGMSRPELLDDGVPAEGRELSLLCHETLPELVDRLGHDLRVAISRSGGGSLAEFHTVSEVEILSAASRQELGPAP